MADTYTINPVADAVDAAQQKAAEPVAGITPKAPELKTEESPPADPRLEALARKERQFAKQRKEIEAERAALKSKMTEYETGYIPKSRLTEDPFGALNELGLTCC